MKAFIKKGVSIFLAIPKPRKNKERNLKIWKGIFSK